MHFAQALEQVLYQVRNANPRYGPLYLSKVDLADGFCQVWLMINSIPQLAVTFPKYPGEEQLVGLPLTLPMGWLESVPFFCATTEMVADRANSRSPKEQLLPHPLEKLALTKLIVESNQEDPPMMQSIVKSSQEDLQAPIAGPYAPGKDARCACRADDGASSGEACRHSNCGGGASEKQGHAGWDGCQAHRAQSIATFPEARVI